MRYFKLIIPILTLIIFTMLFRSIFAYCGDGECVSPEDYSNCFIDCNSTYYGACSQNFMKDNGACIEYDTPAYTIVNSNLPVNPVMFGNIKVVGGEYVDLDTTNATSLSIRKLNNEVVSSNVNIFNVDESLSTKKTFVLYLNPANITENYLEAYKFFFNLVYGPNSGDNKDISLPFRLFK